jgi:hypothetical protein
LEASSFPPAIPSLSNHTRNDIIYKRSELYASPSL